VTASDPVRAVQRLEQHIAQVFLGKPEAVQLGLVALLAEGHMLIEDVPGVGKTLLAKAIARSLRCSYHRVQFTPDLLPTDLIGTNIYDPAKQEFVFKPGPIFANVVLADEINRATPRTQSALLEAMSEQQVSVDGKTYRLEPPFLVLGTQNPHEYEGTYPLPENQLDRFALRVRIGYPSRNVELEVLRQHREGEPVDKLPPILSGSDVLRMQEEVRGIRVDDSLAAYLMDLVEATRYRKDVFLGASIRGSLTLYRAAQALAYVKGRDYVVPDDIKYLAKPVLAHRILSASYRYDGRSDSGERIIQEILDQTPVPV